MCVNKKSYIERYVTRPCNVTRPNLSSQDVSAQVLRYWDLLELMQQEHGANRILDKQTTLQCSSCNAVPWTLLLACCPCSFHCNHRAEQALLVLGKQHYVLDNMYSSGTTRVAILNFVS